MREGLKTFSDWPTFPQLYTNGELVGGLDIVSFTSTSGVKRSSDQTLTYACRFVKKWRQIQSSSSHLPRRQVRDVNVQLRVYDR